MLSKVYKCKFLLAMLLVPFLATAQPAGWETTETLFTHVLSIPASVTPEIDGVPISTGDWVGVFYNDGGVLKCGGNIQYTEGVANAFSAFGNDPTTSEKDGFDPMESFLWRAHVGGDDFWCEAELDGPETFTVFGFTEVISLMGPTFSIAASADPTLICGSGADVTLTGTLLAGDPVDTWEWFDNGTSLGTGETFVVYVDKTTNFKVVATSGLLTAEAFVTVQVSNLSAGDDATLCAVPGLEIQLDPVVPTHLSLLWATNGTGTFDNAFIANAVYYPSEADLAGVELTLTVVTLECGELTESVTFDFQASPSINIIPDYDFVCFDENYDFTGKVEAENYDMIQWFTTNGGGTYTPNEIVLEPTYNPSPTVDLPQRYVILGVSASAIDPCEVADEDFMYLFFVEPTNVFAGDPAELCVTAETATYTFDNAVVEFDSWYPPDEATFPYFDIDITRVILWTSTGDGSFDDPAIAQPTYSFGPNDLENCGLITFTLTVHVEEACEQVVSVTSIFLQAEPSINIIPESYTICEGECMNFEGLVEASNYSRIQWFTTNGGGEYDDENILEPEYCPSPTVDYPQQCITLGVAAEAINPCIVSAEDFMELCFQMLPVVVAGEDATVCSNELYTTNPTVENSNGPYLWTVNPADAGTFADATALVTTFNPSHLYDGQTVTLTLTVDPIEPCTDGASGSMNLYIEHSPYVNAGPDMTICSNGTAIIQGECQNVSFTMWATTGDGYFECPDFTCQEVEYFPGPGDLAAGCVTLVLIGYPLEPCTMYVLDKMVLCFDPEPIASAGPDMTICEGDGAQLEGTGENICNIQWVTVDGTGEFNDETILTPVYTPSAADVILGEVHLKMIVAGCGTCSETVLEPEMTLTIQRTPQITLGQYPTICEDGSILLDQTEVLYYTSVEWRTEGDGTFDDVGSLTATYTPGPEDIANNHAVLCLTAYPIGPCTEPVEECIEIGIQQLPYVNIIPESATICEGDVFDFTDLVEAGNYAAIQWATTTGGGTFTPGETILEPTYQPNAIIDWPQGCIKLIIHVSPLDPCTITAVDSMNLCFQKPVVVDAGDDATICEDGSYTLNPTIENGGDILWTTSGDGTFDDPGLASATYTPGPEDIESGSVVLTIEVEGLATCDDVSDELTLYIQLLPIASAGEDQTVCEQLCTPPWTNTPVPLEGAVLNACGSEWTTAGDGTFNDAGSVTATYTLGDGDIATGQVILTLTAIPCDPCTVSDSDDITITIQPFPIADAGPDQTICEGEIVQLDGAAQNHSGVFWDYALLGEGDGTFSNKLILNPTYTPGPEDIELGYVELILVAFPIEPCTYPDADNMTVFIIKNPVVSAGPDATICEGESYELIDAVAENYEEIRWTADPADFGEFDDPTVVNPTFTPFPGKSGFVTLTIEAIGSPQCVGAVITDDMTLFVNDEPKISFGFNGIEAGWNAEFEYCYGTEIGITLYAYYGGTAPYTVTYTVNSGPEIVVTDLEIGDYIAAPQVYEPGVYEVVVTAIEDANGCFAGEEFLSRCKAIITVWEEVTLVCPDNIIVDNDEGLCGAEVEFEAVVAGEPEPINVTYVYNGEEITSPYFFEVGTHTVYVTVENECATLTCTFEVVVEDMEEPTIDCVLDQDRFTDPGECFYTVNGDEFDAVALDNCIGDVEIINNINDLATLEGYQFEPGDYTVIWTATDGAGNVATCTFDLTVTDNELPTIECPDDISQFNDAKLCGAYIEDIGYPVIDDNCGVVTPTNNAPEDLFFPVGETIVTWTVTDIHGNTATCTQIVTIIDNEDPSITCPNFIEQLADEGECFATIDDLGEPTVDDNCEVEGVTNDAPPTFPVGITTVTWTVTDIHGNTATCTQMVIVIDTELPTIVCPEDIAQSTDAGVCSATVDLGEPVVDDNCGIAEVTNDAPATFPVGVSIVTWTVTDIHNNVATCTQTVTITDDELPTIVCPDDIEEPVEEGQCYAIIEMLENPVVDDNCGVESVINNAPTPFPVGVTIVTWTVTDVNGNIATCTQIVTITEDEPPTIVCPEDIVQTADEGECFATIADLGEPVVDDNCGVDDVTNDAPDTFPVGVTTVTWTVSDINGNIATCTQIVTVTDDEAPTIECPEDILHTADAGLCSATIADLGEPVVDDNCGVEVVTNDAPESFPVGQTIVTWTVTDIHGNTATCTQTVTVTDDEPPTIVCPDDITVPNDIGYCGAYVQDLGVPQVDDNCGVEGYTNNAPQDFYFPVGVSTVTWTVTDIYGNTASCVQTITVNDTEPPVITLIGDDNIELCEGDEYEDAGAEAIDNCDGNITENIVVVNPVDTSVPGVYTITYNVSDAAGNAAEEVTRTVTVYSQPVAFAGDDITICETDDYTTSSATATYASGVYWETKGDGYFENDNELETVYYPGEADLEAGSVELCLTVYPLYPCTIADEDCMILYFDPAPTAFAGDDATICEGDEFELSSATADKYSAVKWTGGDGVFVPSDDVLNPTYQPGENDIADGEVGLCLTVYGTGGCINNETESCLNLVIVPKPAIDVEPEIKLVCSDYDFVNEEFLPIPVSANVENAVSVQWSTNGDGYFDDPTAASTNYNIGTNDNWAQMITLTIKAFGPGSCEFVAEETIELYIPTQLILIDDPTWWGISSFVDKSATPLPEVMEPAVLYPGSDALVILENKAGKYFWPEPTPPINQIGNWGPIGYKAKFKKETCIPIYGDVVTDLTFEIGGPLLFTYVPVLTNVVTPIADLFAGHLDDIMLIYDWNEAKLWAEQAQDLTDLLPGKAYLYLRKVGTAPYTVTFPDFDPNAGHSAKVATKSVMSFSSPWNEVINTSQVHFILFADQVINQLQAGDVLGVFNSYDQCVGVSEFTSRDSFMKLLAMGDDPLSDNIDGLQVGENMTFKLYRQSTDETFDITFTYDTEYPNYDNTFEVVGVSYVIGMKMTATSIGVTPNDMSVSIFPNPANDVLNVVSDYTINNITLVNYVGQTVNTIPVNSNTYTINVSNYAPGMYFVRLETTEGTVITKRVTIN